MKDEDAELVRNAQAGSRAAFEALIDKYYEMMYRVAYRWCGNRSDAEDITHNAFLKLAENLGSFKFKSSFRTWLFRLVINSAHDWHRRNARHRKKAVELSDNLAGTETADRNIAALEIVDAVRSLSKGEQEALILVAGEDLSHKEAADILGCRESTISWRIHEARKKLYELLGRKEDGR